MTAKVTLRGLLIAGFAIVVSVAGLVPLELVQLGPGRMRLFAVLWSLVVGAWCLLVCSPCSDAFGKGSATNAMTLAGCWPVGVVLLPASITGRDDGYPVPSRVQMIQAIRTASDSAMAEGFRVLARYYKDHPELVTAADRRRRISMRCAWR